MPVILNVRQLELEAIECSGVLPVDELDWGPADDLMRPAGGLEYDFVAEQQGRGILLQGRLRLVLDCECARCLRAFRQDVVLENWARLLCWEGEEAVKVVHDCVDLTPYLREDMVLALPQRPLCKPECGGLPVQHPAPSNSPMTANPPVDPSSAWRELDKLKF